MTLRYFSVCSGIEAATVAWSPLGFQAVGFSETAPFPSAVLKYHYPDVPNYGDMTNIDAASLANKNIHILVGGTPCQAFSVAGKRKSLSDKRGQLTLKFVELANAICPDFVIWENVPGVLQLQDNAFGCLLGALASGKELQCPNKNGRWSNAGSIIGTKRIVAWRVLDAQFFGVPQRRKRVFLIASPRKRASPFEILFERTSSVQSSMANKQTPETDTRTPSYCFINGVGYAQKVMPTIIAHMAKGINGWGDEGALIIEPCETIEKRKAISNLGLMYNEPSYKLRRLTLTECERLQGFPDNYTNIIYKDKPASDTVRYTALGNSMAVPVMRWIGQRVNDYAFQNALYSAG